MAQDLKVERYQIALLYVTSENPLQRWALL